MRNLLHALILLLIGVLIAGAFGGLDYLNAKTDLMKHSLQQQISDHELDRIAPYLIVGCV